MSRGRIALLAVLAVALALTATAVTIVAVHGRQLRKEAARRAIALLPTVGGLLPARPAVIGMNLGNPAYYSAEWPFSNIIKSNADFDDDGKGRQRRFLGAGGYPVDAPIGEGFNTPVEYTDVWRTGTYDCSVSPGWRIVLPYAGRIEGDHGRFRLVIPKAEPRTNVTLQVRATQDHASLRALSCTPADQPPSLFAPAFLEDMRPFRVIRFMDWMKTNNAAPQSWAARPKPGDLSIVRGASIEDMVDLANTLHADPWFNLPFDANADYYRRFAMLVRHRLAPGLKAYVELSNEVWNPYFAQSRAAAERGRARYPGVDEQKATDYYYGDRIREVMAIWSGVFAGQEGRIVRVATNQNSWPTRAIDILGHGETYRSLDALAVAPYFGGNIQDIPETGAARVDRILARLSAQADETIGYAAANKAIAWRYGLRLIGYEGGPEITAFSRDAGQDAATAVRDPRFYRIYTAYLSQWRHQVGDVLVLFDAAGSGAFAHKDHTGQPLADAPKMRAVVDFIGTLPRQP